MVFCEHMISLPHKNIHHVRQLTLQAIEVVYQVELCLCLYGPGVLRPDHHRLELRSHDDNDGRKATGSITTSVIRLTTPLYLHRE